MKFTWGLFLCLFGQHDPGEWQPHNQGCQVKVCRRCDKKTLYRAIRDVDV